MILVTVKDTTGLFIEDFCIGGTTGNQHAKAGPHAKSAAEKEVVTAMVLRGYNPTKIVVGFCDHDAAYGVYHALMVVPRKAKAKPKGNVLSLNSEENE